MTQMEHVNWAVVLVEIEDHLGPRKQLDVFERSLYYHRLRHTHVEKQEAGVFSIQGLATAIGVSESKARMPLRSLDTKGCVKIENRSGQGHTIRIVLPREIPEVVPVRVPAETPLDLEAIDF